MAVGEARANAVDVAATAVCALAARLFSPTVILPSGSIEPPAAIVADAAICVFSSRFSACCVAITFSVLSPQAIAISVIISDIGTTLIVFVLRVM